MVLAIYGKATLLLSVILIINGACHIWQGNISVIRHFQIPLFFGALLLPQFFFFKFATFEEAGRLCKTIPQNGVKVAPLGGRSVPKLPH